VAKIVELRADNVDGSHGLGGNSPIATTWHDLSGSGHNGALTNWPTNASNPIYNVDGWSNVNSAATPVALFAFTPTPTAGSEYVDIGNLGSFPSTGSLEIWFTQAVFDPGVNHRNLFSTNRGDTTNNAIRLEQVNSPANELDCVVGDGAVLSDNLFGTASNVLNVDMQLVVTWNTSTNTFVGYLNGLQVFSNTVTHWPTSMPDVALFDGWGTTRKWWGSIRIFRMYNTVLAAGDVMTNYLADAHVQLSGQVGVQTSYSPPLLAGDSYTADDLRWAKSGNTFTFTPAFNDGGRVEVVPFLSANYGRLNVVWICQRDFSGLARYSGNPVTPAPDSGPWTKAEQIIAGTYYSLFQEGSPYNHIILYTSPDLKAWTISGSSPALTHVAGTWEDNFLVHPNVVKDGSTYRCFYEGMTAASSPAIGLATSTDQLTWTKYGGNPVVSLYETPGAWKIANVIYMLAAPSGHATQYLVLFTSTDGGQTWTNQGNVMTAVSGDWDISATGTLDPFVYVNTFSNTYELCYTALKSAGWAVSQEKQRIGHALSMDGYTWFKNAAAMWQTAGQGTTTYDDGYVGDPCINIINNTFYLLYSGITFANANGGGALATMAGESNSVWLLKA
jgi:hypothetical protein